jgi:hypothetical protein
MGLRHASDSQIERLSVARAGGLRVESSDAQLYEELIPLVRAHAQGNFIYAAPDCPEVYFLSGLKSPARHYFDFAEAPVGHAEGIMYQLDRLNVNVVTISSNSQFSGSMAADLRSALEQRYPHFEGVGKFQVRWKR